MAVHEAAARGSLDVLPCLLKEVRPLLTSIAFISSRVRMPRLVGLVQ
jgi:hypothetical protein